MTTLPAPPARRPLRLDRSWLLLAAPLVAASWLPWWGVLAFVLVLLLTHLDPAAQIARVPLLLLAAGLTVLPLLLDVLSEGLPALLAYAALVLPVLGTAALLHIGLSFLELGRPVGIAWLALLLLPGVLGLSPSPVFGLPAGLGVGLLALLLCGLGSIGREERPAHRLAGSGRGVGQSALAGALLAGALALGTLALPPQTGEATPPPAAATVGTEQGSAAPEGEAQEAIAVRPTGVTVWRSAGGRALPGADLIFLGMALFLLAGVFVLWRLGSGRARSMTTRFHWWEIAAVAGMILTALLLVAYGISARLSGALPAATGAAAPSGAAQGELVVTVGKPPSWLAPLAHGFNLIAFVAVLLFCAALVILAWKLRRSTAEEGGKEGDDGPTSATQPEALHRVRLAYRAALASLAGAGLGRGPAETPAEHASRVAAERPALHGPLSTLVAVYAPVRYGGRVTEEEAVTAERAAREVAQLAARSAVAAPERETP
ncbi:DUF4129 domain-containing protein [Deinococcus sp. YIM 77859]|uniref:DUF4129 domain-containing protein n=1 Tax=Deinococcus sp. YIM 77859 TaxID=1540221 RepID=UPI0005529928|nr:DUF4129 domain-containing protein [Deinococcus sp. YIM 77859]